MAHQLGGFYNLPHGVCNAILLPYVSEFNLIAAPERFARIAALLGVNTAGLRTTDAAAAGSRPPLTRQTTQSKFKRGNSTDLPDLKLLQLFDLLYDVRDVTRVAEQLGQSQPTVSIWLGRLREHLQDPLFVRTPGGMAPTPQADALIGPCREILESLRRFAAWEIAFDPATAQRRFRICMTDASHITLLPRMLAHVRAQVPGIRLEAARIDGNTERALESGEADLAIGHVPWLGGGIYQQQLYTQDWVCLTNRHHPRLRARLGVKQYRTEGHVAITAGTGAQLLEQALVREHIEREVVLELPGFLGLGAIIQTTDLIATLPRHIGEALAKVNDLVVHPCPVPVDGFAVRQHWHARYHHEAGNRWLRGLVAQLFRSAR